MMRMSSEERRAMIAGWADEEPAATEKAPAEQAPVPESDKNQAAVGELEIK